MHPEGHEHIGAVARQHRPGQPQAGDRLEIVKDLPPFPTVDQLLKQYCGREHCDPPAVGILEAPNEPAKIQVPVKIENSRHRGSAAGDW